MTEPENTPALPPAIPRIATSTTLILRARAVPTPAALRDELEAMVVREGLDRLLLLNHERHEAEVKVGLFEMKGAKGRTGGKKGGRRTCRSDVVCPAFPVPLTPVDVA